MAHVQAEFYEKSLREAEEAISQDPCYVKAFIRKANAEEKLEIDAVPTYRKILELDPQNPRARSEVTAHDSLERAAELLSEGDALFQSRDREGASRPYTECVAVLTAAAEEQHAHKLADKERAIYDGIARASLKAAACFLEIGEVSQFQANFPSRPSTVGRTLGYNGYPHPAPCPSRAI